MIRKNKPGFSLIEAVVGIAIFAIVAVGLYAAWAKILQVVRLSRQRTAASALAGEEFELIRNLAYASVGTIGGIPSGVIAQTQNAVRDGMTFSLATTIRNVDDPFDGTIGGTPNDLAPADYKLVSIVVSCSSCENFPPVTFTSTVAPKSLEGATTNGALFVRVFNANGQAVSNATVNVQNPGANPAINITDVTTQAGMLQIVDAPPGVEAYQISVSKSGYSSDQTYPSGAPGNPNPLKPRATVAVQQVTQTSFAIDRTSTLAVSSVAATCAASPNVSFSLAGQKLIGTSPNVLKYSLGHTTAGDGTKSIAGLEWDTYGITLTDAARTLIGTIPLTPLILAPNAIQNIQLVVAPKNPQGLLVTVRDAATSLPVAAATVTLGSASLTTGRGFLGQTDWSGGPGQTDFIDPTRYLSSDGNVETASPSGELKLVNTLGTYQASGVLTSSGLDAGPGANFYQISWQPTDQPIASGPGSVRFQIATNNDNATWNFVGPNETASTFYTTSNTNISGSHANHRYLRYRVYLETASATSTPNIADVAFTFTSACLPPGQVFFGGLANGTYPLAVTKLGYQPLSATVNISAPWQSYTATLTP